AEFTDRWRTPGDRSAHQWEERFGELHYEPVGQDAWDAALKAAGVTAGEIDRLVVTGTNERAVRRIRGRLGVADGALVDDLSSSIGNTGTAHPLLLLVAALEAADPGDVVALLHLSDGADGLVMRVTDARAGWRPRRTVSAQIAAGGPVAYGKMLAWRGMASVQPPNRPPPDRVSAPASARNRDWKFGLATGEFGPLGHQEGTVNAFTVDRLAYSPSPPVVFAVVDFDGGRRLPVELTDVDEGDVSIGARVEMTFRRLSTSGGLANYFWKARPVRVEQAG
ncbi:MAG: OB-fold domain-containing protein, partial [Acidimicrobiales bacterium]